MQVAIVSDIHANRHAFQAVLEDIAAGPAVEVWCLGDVVGYGADPNDSCELAREHSAVVLSGNHDLAVTGELPLDEFSRGAAIAARWTQEVLDPDHRDWLARLSPQGEERGLGLFHASPRDPVWEYVLSTLLAELCLDRQDQPVCLIGHSHVALSFTRAEGEATTGEARRAGDSADRLKNDLADIRQAVDQSDCRAATAALAAFRADLGRVPPSVDHRLTARLKQGADKLANRFPTDCTPTTSTSTQTTTTTTAPTTSTATTTTPTSTTTTPTSTTTTPTTPTTPTDTT